MGERTVCGAGGGAIEGGTQKEEQTDESYKEEKRGFKSPLRLNRAFIEKG